MWLAPGITPCVKSRSLLNYCGVGMAGFIAGVDRGQLSLLPERLDQWVEESNPVRVIDAFVEQLDLDELRFKLAAPADPRTARLQPGEAPARLNAVEIAVDVELEMQREGRLRGRVFLRMAWSHLLS